MMKKQQHNTGKKLRKAGHLILVVLLFASTTSMTVSVHYCNHHVYDIGVFSPAESCCMLHANTHQKTNHGHCDIDVQQKGHCEDESLTVDRVDDFLTSAFRADFTSESASDVPVIPSCLSNPYPVAASRSVSFPVRDHAPPGITVEHSFLQIFLF